MELPRNWNMISAAIVAIFVAVALTFGMGEWKDANTATAHGPTETPTKVH
jgi:hypothetical protein